MVRAGNESRSASERVARGSSKSSGRSLVLVSRDVISDEAWAVLGPLFPAVKATGRPPVERRTVVEAAAWRVSHRGAVA